MYAMANLTREVKSSTKKKSHKLQIKKQLEEGSEAYPFH